MATKHYDLQTLELPEMVALMRDIKSRLVWIDGATPELDKAITAVYADSLRSGQKHFGVGVWG